MYKWMEGVSWFFIVVAALFLLFGLIGALRNESFIFTPRGCSTLSLSFLLFALNFSVLRISKLKEKEK